MLSIRKKVTAINAPGVKYRAEENDSDNVSSEGSEIKKYFEGKSLRRVTLNACGAMGNTQVEYYFSGDKLIFCYEVSKLCGGKMSYKNRPFISNAHNRYYLHTVKPFRFANKQGRKIEGKVLKEKEKNLKALKQVL